MKASSKIQLEKLFLAKTCFSFTDLLYFHPFLRIKVLYDIYFSCLIDTLYMVCKVLVNALVILSYMLSVA